MTEQAAGRATSPARRDISDKTAPNTGAQQPAGRPQAAAARQKPKFAAQDVPGVPTLAEGVVLSGQMEESAFVEEPALIQKDGRFIQLTDLLFLIVKNIDGKISVDDIAAAVTKEHDTEVTADEVRTLIAEKLMPIGVVATADGKVAQSTTARSPLQLNMKVAMISPALLKAATYFLQALFIPFILIPLLAIAFAIVGWVFLMHGVASGLHDAFYTPGLLLVTFLFVVVSAAFHELGHAAGLRAGGKLPRAMGVGLYLVYPAFYTDVSENYQLKRWERVRTDLGGFYFNLIFVIGVVAVYLATRWEYLLFLVALICLEIIHQLLPFVRLDGYWALADMLGIPDFFSQMAAFVRSVLPFRIGSGGRKLPALKWWARAAFALYIVIVVPLLAVFLFSMIKAVPRVVATAFDAAAKLTGQLGEAFAKGEFILVAAIVLQLVFIALPTMGLALTLFSLARALVVRLWSFGRRSPARAAVTAIGSAAAVALLVFLWVPQVGTLAGVRSGALAGNIGEFRPIESGERGTIGEAIPVVNDLLRGVGIAPVGSGSPSPSPSASPSGAASPSATPAPTATTGPATAAPFVPTAQPRTAAPTVAPTVAPTAAPTATP